MDSSRFTDDLHLVSVDEYQPTTVRALLRHLNLTAAATGDQEAGLRDWLANHPPTPMLAYSMRDSGYGHLLDRPSS